MNLLALIQTAAIELGLPSPTAVVASTDSQVLQLFGLANNLGRELLRQYEWQRLETEYKFQTVAVTLTGTTTLNSPVVTGLSTSGLSTDFAVMGTNIPVTTMIQSVDSGTQVTMDQNATGSGTVTLTFPQVRYALPAGFNRMQPQTEWDRTNHWPLLGPKTPQEWAYMRGGIVASGPRMRFRILQNKFQLFPVPGNAWNLAFEYISGNWAINGSTPVAAFTTDTDTCIYDDQLIVLGIKYKWQQQKGLDSQLAYSDYQKQLSACLGQDQDMPVLSLQRVATQLLISAANAPESGYGQ